LAIAPGAGNRPDRVLWIRCAHNAEHALKATDLLIPAWWRWIWAIHRWQQHAASPWFRGSGLRRAVEYTPTVLIALARQSNAKTCASLMLDCQRERVAWAHVLLPLW
jgi:hypothetical protein